MEEITQDDKNITIPSEKKKTSNLVLDIDAPKISQESLMKRQQDLTSRVAGQEQQSLTDFQASRSAQEEALIGSLGRGQSLGSINADTRQLSALRDELDRLGELEMTEKADLITDSQRRGRVQRQLTGLQGVQESLQESRRERVTNQLATEQAAVTAELERQENVVNAYFDEKEKIVAFQRELVQDNKDLFKTFSARGYDAVQKELDREQKAVDTERLDVREANMLKKQAIENYPGMPQNVKQALLNAKNTSEVLEISNIGQYLQDPMQELSLTLKRKQIEAMDKEALDLARETGTYGNVIVKDKEAVKLKGISELENALIKYEDAIDEYGASRKSSAKGAKLDSRYQEVLQAYRQAKDLGQLQGGDLELVDEAIKKATYKGTVLDFVPGVSQVTRPTQALVTKKRAEASIKEAMQVISENKAKQKSLFFPEIQNGSKTHISRQYQGQHS